MMQVFNSYHRFRIDTDYQFDQELTFNFKDQRDCQNNEGVKIFLSDIISY